MKGGSSHSSARTPGRVDSGDGPANRFEAALEPVAESNRPLGDTGGLAQPRDVREHLGEVGGIE